MAYPIDKSYKIVNNPISEGDHIITQIGDTQISIPRVDSNGDYQQFLKDIKKQGYSIVEGPTVGITTDYKEARRVEYPPMKDQLDKIYHSGVNAWKADIKVIKDKYPKSQVGVTTVAAVPSWVKEAVDAAD
tara:strand:- start:19 stop:411 length:393 start_codon:yes stop_codon:yes gene_type:complete